MKILILILICSTAFGQSKLETNLSKEICSCLSNEKGLKQFSSEIFSDCFFKAARKYYSEIKTECVKLYGDTSSENARKMGKKLQDDLSVFMIDNCEIYYSLRTAKRQSELLKITSLNKDSLNKIIDSLGNITENRHDYSFFQKRASTLFRLANYDQAINDFDKAVKLDESDYSSLGMKAWAYELIGKYELAIKCYDILSKKMQVSLFSIYSAMARRKQNGL